MQTIHITELDEHNPGYKDRHLIWCKVYFKMVNADPMFEMLCEIDKWRYVALVMLELQIKQPVPLDEEYLKRKGFDFRGRSMSLTLKMLHTLVEVCNDSVTQNRIEENRIEENRIEENSHEIDLFDEARKLYPGTKRGLQTEYANFCKKHKDWNEALALLTPAIENQKRWRETALPGEFRPVWKNFATWINNRCWEEELDKNKFAKEPQGTFDVGGEGPPLRRNAEGLTARELTIREYGK